MSRPLFLAALLVMTPALAQSGANNTGRDQALAFVLLGTAAPGIAFDVLMIVDLFSDGMVRKGYGINAVIFGSIALATGALAGAILVQDVKIKGWGSAAIGLGVFGAGTSVLGIWGLTHSRPPEGYHYQEPEQRPRYQAPPPPSDFSPPPPPPPLTILVPQIGFTPHGGVIFGLAGTL